MGKSDIDNGYSVQEGQPSGNEYSVQDGSGSAGTSTAMPIEYGQGQMPSVTEMSPSAGADSQTPSTAQSLENERKAKVSAILNGTYDPKLPALSAMPQGMTGYEAKKEEPWIGPDGGPIGRWIKRQGDAYQGYIDNHRDGLMETMREKMTPPDWAVDALATGANSLTTGLTGINTGYEPRYWGNKIFQLASFGPGGAAGSLLSPIPAAIALVRMAGGEQLQPSEMLRAGASALNTGIGAAMGFTSPLAWQAQKFINQNVKAAILTDKVQNNQF